MSDIECPYCGYEYDSRNIECPICGEYLVKEEIDHKELIVIEQPELKTQYGGRTLVEKVTAYKLSDGEIVESKEMAHKFQKQIDFDARVDIVVKKYLSPYDATRVEGGVLSIEREVVSLLSVKQLLRQFKYLKKELE